MAVVNASDKKYSIDRLNNPYGEAEIELFTAIMMDKQYKAAHWNDALSSAKKHYDYYTANIFDENKKAALEEQGKYPMETSEYEPYVNALVSTVSAALPRGKVEQVSFTGSPDSVSAEDMDLLLRKIKLDLNIKDEIEETITDGLISGYFQAIVFDVEEAHYGGNGKLVANRYPYDSVLVGRSWNGDVRNIKDVTLVNMMTLEEIVDRFPEKEDVIRNYIAENYFEDQVLIPNDNFLGVTNEAWDLFISEMQTGWGTFQDINAWTTYRRLYPITAEVTRYINTSSGDVQILPYTWDEERVREWLNDPNNAGYEEVRGKATVLWDTTVTQTGIILDNRPCWYQNNGELPVAIFVANMVNRKPRGLMDNLAPFIFAGAVAETEGLGQVVQGNRTMTYMFEGSVDDPESVRDEFTKEKGLVLVKAGKELPKEHQSKPNDSWLQYRDRNTSRAQQSVRVNDQMLGGVGQYQNAQGIQTALQQGLSAQGAYLRNAKKFDLQINKIILASIPVFMTEEEVIRIEDEFGKPHEFVVNEELEGEDDWLGALLSNTTPVGQTVANKIVNDLTSAKYVYAFSENAESDNSRKAVADMFMQYLQAGLGQMANGANPKLYAAFLKTYPERYFRRMGEEAEAALEKQEQMQQEQMQMQTQTLNEEAQKERVFEFMKEIVKRSIPQILTNVRPEGIVDAPDGFKATIEYQNAMIESVMNTAMSTISENTGANPEEILGEGGEPEQMPPQI